MDIKHIFRAGSITSNVKSDKTLVTLQSSGSKIETGLKKVGAMIGDHVEVGCNSVLNPGTIIGREAQLYPLSMVRGLCCEKAYMCYVGEIIEKN